MRSSSQAGVPGFDAVELDELKRKLVTACRILHREGITEGYGHVSARSVSPGWASFSTWRCFTASRAI